jgi:hypothetical protein
VRDPSLSCIAWYAIKDTCEHFPFKQHKKEKILYELIPKYVIKAAKEVCDMDRDKKISHIIKITDCLKYEVEEKQRIESRFAKLIYQIK